MKTEKNVVFDDDGNPKELRYYEDGKLCARLGVILDGDKNFIGMRELDVEEVSPPSWLDRLRLRKRETRVTIHTIDFIGLINWINTIKTIKTIENIDLIKEITKVGEITSIKDITWNPRGVIQDPSFESLVSWIKVNNPSIDTVVKHRFGASCKLPQGSVICGVAQILPIPICVDWFTSLNFWLYASLPAKGLTAWYYYEDGTEDFEDFNVANASNWERKTCTFTAGKYLQCLYFYSKDQATATVHIDDLGMVF